MKTMFPTTKNRNRFLIAITVVLLSCTGLWGCKSTTKYPLEITKSNAMIRLDPSEYPEFGDDMGYDGLKYGIQKSLEYLNRIPAGRSFQFGPDSYTAGDLIRSLEDFRNYIQQNPTHDDLTAYIRSGYRVYKSIGNEKSGDVLFTGYFEPSLKGSRYRDEKNKYPVYGPPDDLIKIDLSSFSPEFKGKTISGRFTGQTIVPYYERSEIEDKGVLDGKAEPLAWVSDRIGLFFLQIQGSGKILLNTGETLHIHYHSQNGRPYKSIGRLLIDEGRIPREEMSMQRLRKYLGNHPDDVDRILDYNSSYIFFSLEEDGPFGALDILLTPGRSLAVDRRLFPLPALSFIQSRKPLIDGSGRIDKWVDLFRFVLCQDTGGAIRGPGRADMFWGSGDYAEIAAGHMKHHGSLYFFVLKPESAE